LKANSGKSFVPPHPVCWKSLQLDPMAGSEIGIRHEEKFVLNVQVPQMSRLDNSGFHTANNLLAKYELFSHELRDW
jgi:hypothetical protein